VVVSEIDRLLEIEEIRSLLETAESSGTLRQRELT
jgi:hypothetical protein